MTDHTFLLLVASKIKFKIIKSINRSNTKFIQENKKIIKF